MANDRATHVWGFVGLGVGVLLVGIPGLAVAQGSDRPWWVIPGIVLGCIFLVAALVLLLWPRRKVRESLPMSNGPTFNVNNYGAHGLAIGQQNIHIGPQSRTFSTRDTTALVAAAQQFSGTTVDLACLMGDGEGIAFAHELKALLDSTGWHVDGVSQAVFSGPVEGVVLRCADAAPPPWLTAIGNALLAVGIRATGQTNAQLDGIIVGSAV